MEPATDSTEPLVVQAAPRGSSAGAWHAPPAIELRAMYRAYRRRQCRRLAAMLPREQIRPLYRAAAAAAAARRADDPLEILVEHCASFLPLPPFRVWLEDLARHPEAHIRDLDDSVDAPTPAAPLTLAERELPMRGETWRARLRSFRTEGAWRGFIAFHGPSSSEPHRTAVVFRESGPEHLRDRFLGFERATLEAFLRSCAS